MNSARLVLDALWRADLFDGAWERLFRRFLTHFTVVDVRVGLCRVIPRRCV